MVSTSNRREFLKGSAILPFAVSGATSAGGAMTCIEAAKSENLAGVEADLMRYIGFGNKQSGGEGDNACGDWLASELENAGFTISRQSFSAPYFTPDRCDISVGDISAPVWPQPIVQPTDQKGITAPLVRVDGWGNADSSLKGAIALVDLPENRWSSVFWLAVRTPLEAAYQQGAIAAVIVTNGPTGKIVALNTDGRKPMYPGPTALLAPEDSRSFYNAASRRAEVTLRLTGNGGRRQAFNFAGTLDRGRSKWLVVSTPRSGWFTCAGERGPGIAAWLHIARWASHAVKSHNLAFICNSGHEYQYLGAEEALHAIAPKPADTTFWLHLGANIAARDWHGITGKLEPLPGADSQRYLVTSPPLLDAARQLFKGQAGLEAPYPSNVLSAGELTNVIDAGYPSVAGVFGLHRFHHVTDDDERCVPIDKVAEAATAFRKLVSYALAEG